MLGFVHADEERTRNDNLSELLGSLHKVTYPAKPKMFVVFSLIYYTFPSTFSVCEWALAILNLSFNFVFCNPKP